MSSQQFPIRTASRKRVFARIAACLLAAIPYLATAAESSQNLSGSRRADGDAVAGGGLVQGPHSAASALPRRGICAHRGASTSHPENTLAALREAIRLGAHQIELDVYLTTDKQLVVMHDATVDRTTDGKGKIADLTLAQIKQLDAGRWKAPRFAGERVPTLAEAQAVMPENVWLNLHLKGKAELGTAVARQVVHDQRTHQAFVAAGFAAADAARAVCPQLLICNMERQEDYSRYIHETISRRADFIQLFNKLAAPADMAKLKAARVRINYCCTNDPAALEQFYAAGVDFPLVDDVAKMIRAAERLGIPPLKPVFRDGQ